ncbi:hypothetical protein OFN73_02670 [Campylobacter sp. JMF_14 EL1]|nr:hypothetical protein [Campylobacter sp. JMF_14 EL1]
MIARISKFYLKFSNEICVLVIFTRSCFGVTAPCNDKSEKFISPNLGL